MSNHTQEDEGEASAFQKCMDVTNSTPSRLKKELVEEEHRIPRIHKKSDTSQSRIPGSRRRQQDISSDILDRNSEYYQKAGFDHTQLKLDEVAQITNFDSPRQQNNLEFESVDEKSSKTITWREQLKVVIPHVTLVAATVLYALLGGGIFFYVERPNEENIKLVNTEKVRNFRNNLLSYAWNITENSEVTTRKEFAADIGQDMDRMVEALFKAFKAGLNDQGIADPSRVKMKWTFPSAVFFSATVITTIGYGDLVPVTFWGRVLCIVYALLGIPLALITIADIGKFVGQLILKTYDQYQIAKLKFCRRRRRRPVIHEMLASVIESSFFTLFTGSEGRNKVKANESKSEVETEASQSEVDIGEALETRVPPSMVLFILMSYTAAIAAVFTVWEGWAYINAFYFSFITMATVGFGDLVPSRESYLFLAILFIVLGLVLTTMCIDLVGSHYIRKIHFFGRKIRNARQALAILGDKAGTVGDWWKHVTAIQHQYGLNDDQLQNMIMMREQFSDTRLCRRAILGYAYMPSEADRMAYIDNVPSSDEVASLFSCLDL